MPRIVDHDARRRELLGDCLHLFAARGYNGLSMRELARQLGVSTGTLYHYFPSKDAIFASMFQQLAADAIESTTAAAPPGAPRAERIAVLARYVESKADMLVQALRIAQEVHRHRADADGQAVLRDTLGAFAAAIDEQLELQSPALARVVLSHLLGTLVHRELDPDHVDLQGHLGIIGAVAAALDGAGLASLSGGGPVGPEEAR
jgi:AcrR family transcriptional regulator